MPYIPISPRPLSPDASWEFVREVLNDVPHSIAGSIRIAIAGSFYGTRKPRLIETVRNYLNLFRYSFDWLGSLPAGLPKDAVLVILPTVTPSSVLALAPVTRELDNRGRKYLLLLPSGVQTVPKEFFRCENQIRFCTFAGLVTWSERLGSFSLAVRLFRQIVSSAKRLSPSAARQMQRFRVRFIDALASANRHSLASRRLFSTWRPACIISTSDLFPLEHQVIVSAREFHIPTVLLQHGVIGPRYFPFWADTFVVWGEPDYATMIQLGETGTRLHISGMPAADRLFRARKPADKSQWDKASLTILLLSNIRPRGPERGTAELHNFLTTTINSHNEHRWVVRLHPTENHEFYRSLGNDIYSRLEFQSPEKSLEEAVIDADICCTLASTAGLEAMMLGRPLLVLAADSWVKEIAWWPDHGGGLYISSATEMSDFISRCCSDSNYRAQILSAQDDFLAQRFKNAGCAAAGVADFIENEIHHLHSQRSNPRQPLSSAYTGQIGL